MVPLLPQVHAASSSQKKKRCMLHLTERARFFLESEKACWSLHKSTLAHGVVWENILWHLLLAGHQPIMFRGPPEYLVGQYLQPARLHLSMAWTMWLEACWSSSSLRTSEHASPEPFCSSLWYFFTCQKQLFRSKKVKLSWHCACKARILWLQKLDVESHPRNASSDMVYGVLSCPFEIRENLTVSFVLLLNLQK